MKRLSRVLLSFFLLTSISAFANSVNYAGLSASFVVTPNLGDGGNFGGTLVGTNVNLTLGGGTPVGWFDGVTGYAPGSGGGGGIMVYFDFASGTLGGQSYGGDNLFPTVANFNAGSFTFPADGSGFTVSVPASLGVEMLTGCPSDGMCTTYNLFSRSGTLVLSFYYDSNSGLYYGSSGSFTSAAVPEPGTLGLVTIGLSALGIYKRKLIRAAP
jgi:PEP-CTERM motif